MNGDFIPTYSTNNIWRDDDMLRCMTLDLEDFRRATYNGLFYYY